jgi:hypothetical protein
MSEAKVSTAVSGLTSQHRMVIDTTHSDAANSSAARAESFPVGSGRRLVRDICASIALVEHVVDDRGAGGGQPDAEIAEEECIPGRHARYRQQRAHDGGEHDEHDDARLRQFVKLRQSGAAAAATMGSGVANGALPSGRGV